MTVKLKYNDWIEQVRHEIYVTTGFHLEELPEFDWWKYYNSSYTPIQAYNEFFRTQDYGNDSK